MTDAPPPPPGWYERGGELAWWNGSRWDMSSAPPHLDPPGSQPSTGPAPNARPPLLSPSDRAILLAVAIALPGPIFAGYGNVAAVIIVSALIAILLIGGLVTRVSIVMELQRWANQYRAVAGGALTLAAIVCFVIAAWQGSLASADLRTIGLGPLTGGDKLALSRQHAFTALGVALLAFPLWSMLSALWNRQGFREARPPES